MNSAPRKYGLLLPHFGQYASRDRLLRGARAAEKYGFDSIWVRDHLVFHPHGMEGQDRTHVDPVVSLALVAGATEKIALGTGSLIPYRHPIQAALLLSSLEFVAGPDRVIAGFGLGTFDHEFEAAGLGGIDRRELIEEQVAIFRLLWTGKEVSFKGKYYEFDDVDIHPSPSAERSIPIWYCGNSPASVRRAVEYCDGWMPGRITMNTFRKRMTRMRRLAAEHERAVPTAAAIPITSPGRTREEALSKVNWQEMMQQAIRAKWELPDSGKWESPEDLEGALIAGPPNEIIAAARRYQDEGLDHLVFDLRFRYEDWDECLAMIGEDVLPELHRGDWSQSTVTAAAAS